MPTFAEQLVLLTIDGGGASLPVREEAFVCALAGAALMDLAFAGRIDTDLQALVVTDRTPTGHRALDGVLAKIAAQDEPVETRAWIGEWSVESADAIRDDVLAGFVERGTLRLCGRRMPWRVHAASYALVDESSKREALQRIDDVLHSDAIPEPHDIALIALLDAGDILPDVLPSGAIEPVRARIGHYALWQAEIAGAAPPGTGVGCATCHMAKSKRRGAVVASHNQNEILRPNTKMIRPVCLDCHGLRFAIDAQADAERVASNFQGKPEVHVESVAWAMRRLRAAH